MNPLGSHLFFSSFFLLLKRIKSWALSWVYCDLDFERLQIKTVSHWINNFIENKFKFNIPQLPQCPKVIGLYFQSYSIIEHKDWHKLLGLLLDLDMLSFWTTSGIVFAQLLYLVVIISWAISLRRVLLRASDWQIATWKGGNNRLTLKFILQTVHYVCCDVWWGEYFGTELYSMMSPRWELQCEMNFNLKVFTQRGEEKKTACFILSGKSVGKLYSTITEANPNPNLLSIFTLQNKLILYSSKDIVTAMFKPGSLTTKLTGYCETNSEL